MTLPPMVDRIGDLVIEHGERGRDLDPVHPRACLCGVGFYIECDDYLAGGGIEGLTLHPGPVSAPEPPEQQSLLRLPAGPHSEPWAALVGEEWDDEDGEDELPVSWFRPVVDVPTGGRL